MLALAMRRVSKLPMVLPSLYSRHHPGLRELVVGCSLALAALLPPTGCLVAVKALLRLVLSGALVRLLHVEFLQVGVGGDGDLERMLRTLGTGVPKRNVLQYPGSMLVPLARGNYSFHTEDEPDSRYRVNYRHICCTKDFEKFSSEELRLRHIYHP